MVFIYKKPTVFPKIGQEIGPDVSGKTIATWPGKSRGRLITYLFSVQTKNGEKLVATTDPKFDAARHTTVPLICFVSAEPGGPDDWIEIRDVQANHVKGHFFYY